MNTSGSVFGRVAKAALLGLLSASSAWSDTLLSEDYETGQVAGNQPAGATIVRPTTPIADISTLVVDSSTNIAGLGNGVRLWDNDTVQGVRLEYDLVGSAADQLSAVRVDYSFAALSTTNSGDYLNASVGEYGVSQTSNSKRFMDCRIYADGTIDFRSSGGPDSANNGLLSSNNTLSAFVNDLDSDSISYTGPDSNAYNLAANSVAYWLNGNFMLETLLEDRTTAAGSVHSSSNNIGRFTYASTTSDYGLNFVVDDIVITSLLEGPPEPPARLHSLFQDHMMLQRDLDVPVWGFADPGLQVDVLFDNVAAGSAVADAEGKWMVRLSPYANDGGVSHELKIQVSNETLQVVSDVIFGDVYLCSGQSNMEWEMSGMLGFDPVYNNDSNSFIRHVAIERGKSTAALDEPSYEHLWTAVTPGEIANFTAVGYMFAKEVYARTGVPVGLLNSSYGGQRIHRYVNFHGLEGVPELAGYLTDIEGGGVSEVAHIYNAQIAPIVPFGICGILWYQGETDRHNPEQYEEKMRALIRGWREVWNYGDLPFYYCQLPHYTTFNYPFIRDGQLQALSETNCGMAVLIDVGDDADIHPTNKQDPGYRLAQWAMVYQYGTTQVYSGPIFHETLQEGAQLRVLFDHAEGGLIIGYKDSTNAVSEVSGGPLQCFEVAGSNRVFYTATATIDSDTVLLSSPSVPVPVYGRYCWSNASNGTNRLYNTAGFPAAAFRTDVSSQLLVESGSGTVTSTAPGTVYAISANTAPSGKIFDRWVGGADAVADANSASTTITMPSRDIYVIATYRDAGESIYTLTVNNGSGGGTAQAGAWMEIVADAAPIGQVFDGWAGTTQDVVDVQSPFTMLRMPPSNITVTATYAPDSTGAPADPAVSDIKISTDAVFMQLQTEFGIRYELERATNLAVLAWQPAIYNIKGDGLEKMLITDGGGMPVQFFRLNYSRD